MASLETVVVVGGSLAGLRALETFRREGFDGRLVCVGAETHLPYDRPPLSKEVLAGVWEPERTALRKDGDYADLDVEWRLGRRAVSLAARARELTLDDGETLRFDRLLIATGATPRRLPCTDGLPGVHVLRTLDDCLALRAELEAGPRVAVVGAGFIGAEVAASCRARGLEVALVEALPVPLAHVLGERLGRTCEALHVDNGVSLRCGVTVAGLEGDGRVEALRLADGSLLPADVVVVGIGVAPETGWLEGSGLALDDGVVCDAHCFAQGEAIAAAGDVARWQNPRYGESMRIEHWTHATEQGVAAARNLLAGAAGAEPFAAVPFFWSDQYGVKIQLAGRPRPDDDLRVVHGTLEERRCVVLFGRAGRLVAALGLSRPRQLMKARRQIVEGVAFEDAVAAAA